MTEELSTYSWIMEGMLKRARFRIKQSNSSQGSKIQVVDVRTPEEFKDGHIPGAKSIPLQDVEKRLGEFNKEQAYLLVCHSGNRSVQAQDILEKHGFNNTYNMLQGMAQWPYKTEK